MGNTGEGNTETSTTFPAFQARKGRLSGSELLKQPVVFACVWRIHQQNLLDGTSSFLYFSLLN